MEDVVMISYVEDPTGIDYTVLNVMRVENDGMHVLNTLIGVEAKEFYRKLTGGNNES